MSTLNSKSCIRTCRVHASVHVHTRTLFTRAHTHTVHAFVRAAYMPLCMCVCVYVCVCVCVYVYLFIHIFCESILLYMCPHATKRRLYVSACY